MIQAGKEEDTKGMQELLQEFAPQKSLRTGEIVDGVVMKVDRTGVLVDIGLKSEGFIPTREMQSLGAEGLNQLRVGDTMVVSILERESQEGQIILSLDRTRGERGWRLLKRYLDNNEPFSSVVIGFNRGGVLVNVEGVRGFVPLSQLVEPPPKTGDSPENPALANMVGKTLQLKVLELERERGRVILSERAAHQVQREQQKERLLAELKEGESRRGRISSVHKFGAFVDLGGADGLIPISELSWDQVKSPEEIVHPGDEVEVYVMKVDPQAKKIGLSLRRAHSEPWEEAAGKYQIGQVVTGTVTKLATFGAFARIDGSIEGLIHISELAGRRVNHPREVVKVGDTLNLKILNIELERRRLSLSLRRAQEVGG